MCDCIFVSKKLGNAAERWVYPSHWRCWVWFCRHPKPLSHFFIVFQSVAVLVKAHFHSLGRVEKICNRAQTWIPSASGFAFGFHTRIIYCLQYVVVIVLEPGYCAHAHRAFSSVWFLFVQLKSFQICCFPLLQLPLQFFQCLFQFIPLLAQLKVFEHGFLRNHLRL